MAVQSAKMVEGANRGYFGGEDSTRSLRLRVKVLQLTKLQCACLSLGMRLMKILAQTLVYGGGAPSKHTTGT